ncbi:Firmicu-CTERM sorting domain-containing protein [Leuconostoc lactis]|nr:Firmicu-CTERM sorting domain-containing protein [Leuconostoc lactis]
MSQITIMKKSRLICLMAILPLQILMPTQVFASDKSGFEQITMTQHNVVLISPWYTENSQIAVGISADKNNIYAALAMVAWDSDYSGASTKWSGHDFRQGYTLIIADERIDFTLGDLGQSGNFHVLYGNEKIGDGNIVFKNDHDVRWQFTIDFKAIQKILQHDIPQNTTITLINPRLFEGAETIRYAGASTGPWLLTGIGLLVAISSYYYQRRLHFKLNTPLDQGGAYA